MAATHAIATRRQTLSTCEELTLVPRGAVQSSLNDVRNASAGRGARNGRSWGEGYLGKRRRRRRWKKPIAIYRHRQWNLILWS